MDEPTWGPGHRRVAWPSAERHIRSRRDPLPAAPFPCADASAFLASRPEHRVTQSKDSLAATLRKNTVLRVALYYALLIGGLYLAWHRLPHSELVSRESLD